MCYVYVLRSTVDEKFYIGFTADLTSRIYRHNSGYVSSTKARRPLELIFYEAYINKYDAIRREKYLKSSKGKTTLATMLRDYLSSL